MPGKKGKKSAKGKRGKKKAAKAKAAAEREEVKGKTKLFFRIYPTYCAAADSIPAPRVITACRQCLEEDVPLNKFVLDATTDVGSPKSGAGKGRKVSKSPPAGKDSPPAASSAAAAGAAPPILADKPPPILLQPLFKSLTEAGYNYMRCLHIWGIQVSDEGAVSLALFLESPLGAVLKVLELRKTELSSWGLGRLSRPLGQIELTTLNLDYNNIQCTVLSKLCEKLSLRGSLHNLSLNFCNLGHASGEILGGFIVTSQLKSLSLIGNSLQCDGCTELVRPLVSMCESSSFNAIKLDTDTPAKEDHASQMGSQMGSDKAGAPSTSSAAPGRGATLPQLARLDLRDNAIDSHGVCSEGEQTFEPVICMRAVKRWLISCPCIEEVNLDHNLIGDGGARELLQGLVLRKEAGLPVMKLIVTVYISQEIYQKIIEYSTVPKKKKKKKKGKKK